MSKPVAHMLVVSPAYPYPPIDGHTLRNYNFLRNMSAGYSFDLLTFSSEGEQKSAAQLVQQLGPRCRQVILVDRNSLLPLRLNPIQKVKNLLFPHVFSCGEGVSIEMSKAISDRIASHMYDLLYCCGVSMGAHAQPYLNMIPSVVDAVDSFSLLQGSVVSRDRGLRRKAVEYINLVWAKRYERLHLGKVQDLIFVSPVDRGAAFQNCPRSTIWVVPNGVDTEYFKAQGQNRRSANKLLFTGVMDYPPNHQAMVYFIEEIFPLIQKHVPDTALVIAGRNPLPSLQRLICRCNGITLTGFVEDMRPYFESSSVYVAPLRSGAGMKNKILEAWAMSMPVVATSVSCSGIEIREGQNILVADSPSAFADGVVRLLRDSASSQKMAQCGRDTAESIYSWQVKTAYLESVLHHVLTRP